jgi:hypothetical protein
MGYGLNAIWIACYEELLRLLNYGMFESVRYKGGWMWSNDLNVYSTIFIIVSVVDSSVGRVLSFSHERPRFKSWCGHLFISLLICDLIDC